MKDQEQEIDLGEVFYVLLSKLHIIAMFAILGAICGFAVSKLVLPEKYTSSVSIYVNNSTESVVSSEGKVNYADITAAQQLAETYIVVLQDDVVYEEVSDLLLQDYDLSDLKKLFTVSYEDGEAVISSDQIKSLVSISTVDETEVISITTVTENPELSADICTYIANIAPDLLTRTTKAGSVETIGSAKVPTAPSSPNHRKNTFIGFAVGFLLAVAIVVIEYMVDNRIKTSEDFKRKFPDIPVLTEIGDLNDNYRGGAKYEYR